MTTTVTNIRVFDGQELCTASAVRFDDEAILTLGGPEIAEPHDNLIDGRHGTLLPGLIDAHVHLLPGAAAQSLEFGVTTILDMFSKPPLVGECLAQGRSPQCANVRTSSVGATAPGGHPSMMYAPFPYVHGPEDAPAFVRERKREGASYLKILYEGGQDIGWAMPSVDLRTVRALARAAHEADMLVVAHIHRAVDAIDVIACGVDVLAHAPADELCAQQIEIIAASGAAIITTLSIADGFPTAGSPMELLTQPALVDRLGPAWTRVIHSQADRWMPPQMPSFAVAHDNVAALHAAGVAVLAGTDAPNPGTVHGASLHSELRHLVKAGFSPVEALRAATITTADAFGLANRGRIQAGAPADLLLVNGKPDEVIEDTQAVEAVWKNGRAVTLGTYPGSPAETSGIEFLNQQTQRVISAVLEKFPEFGSAGGLGLHNGSK